MVLHGLHHLMGHPAGIESLFPPIANQHQRAGQFGLSQGITGFPGGVFHKSHRLGIVCQEILAVFIQPSGLHGGNHKALLRQVDGRLYKHFPGQASVGFPGLPEPGYRAGNAHRSCTIEAPCWIGIAQAV